MAVLAMMIRRKEKKFPKKISKTSKTPILTTPITMKSLMKIPAAPTPKKTMKRPILESSIPILTRFYGEGRRLKKI